MLVSIFQCKNIMTLECLRRRIFDFQIFVFLFFLEVKFNVRLRNGPLTKGNIILCALQSSHPIIRCSSHALWCSSQPLWCSYHPLWFYSHPLCCSSHPLWCSSQPLVLFSSIMVLFSSIMVILYLLWCSSNPLW